MGFSVEREAKTHLPFEAWCNLSYKEASKSEAVTRWAMRDGCKRSLDAKIRPFPEVLPVAVAMRAPEEYSINAIGSGVVLRKS